MYPRPPRYALALLWISLFASAGCPAVRPEISGIEIVENPDNVLSCFVRWATDVPATSRVEFGPGAPVRFAVGDDEPTTDHEVLVFGMRANERYDLLAISATPDGAEAVSDELVFDAGAPPFEGARFELTHHDPQRAQPGWTLTNLVLGATLAPTIAVILDEEAYPIWYHRMGDEVGSGDVEVSLVGDDRILMGGGVAAYNAPRLVDLAGRVLWEGPQQPEGLFAEGGWHHSFRRTADDTFLGLRYAFDGLQLYDRVSEIDEDGETIWSWRSIEHGDVLGDDYPHGNNAMLGHGGDTLYYSSRYTSSLLKLDRESGDVLWQLGEGRDFAYEGEHDTPWFLQAHARQVLPDGNVLLYDNGVVEDREWSRVVEYALDEDTMTATIAWEYPGELADDEWFTFAWGDADRQDNGNTLVCAGTLVGRQSQSRLFEVTPEGDKVWQVLLAVNDEEELAGSYMAQRIPVLLEELP